MTRPPPGGGWRPSSRTSPTGTCGCRGGGSGAAPATTPRRRSTPCGAASGRSRCCWRRTRRSWPRRCGRGWWSRSTRTRPTRCTWRTGRSRTTGGGPTRSCAPPWRRRGAWSRWAARHAPTPGSRCAIGPRFGHDAPKVAAAVRAADAAALAPRLAAGERVEVEVPGRGTVDLGPEEVAVVEEPVTGWRVAREGGSSVALDLEVTPALRREGLARDLVRAVQDLRKEAGLKVSDRIELAVRAEGEVAEAVEAHRDYLLGETLAVELYRSPRGDGFDARVD